MKSVIEWHSASGRGLQDGAAEELGPGAICPNCHREAGRRLILSAFVGADRSQLFACEACSAHFFEGAKAGAYSDLPAGGTDALAFYLQQGANIGGMAMRLQALGRPIGTTYLEVGCGFGLSLDFARRMLGWQVRGLDPSPFAVAGREQLGLPIESRYLEAGGLDDASADVIHASEFIEHIADPVPMLGTLRKALRPGGTLLLTTPAAEMIRPDTGDGLLVPLLSVGWHLVIQTASSLTWALHKAGFDTVSVQREGAQLVAIAGRLPDDAVQETACRSRYRAWLRMIAQAVPDQSDLGFGVRARLYRELAIVGSAEADEIWQALDSLVQERWGHGVDALAAAPADTNCLADLLAREPLGLAGILLARGWVKKQRGEEAQACFEGAIAAAGRLRAALRGVGADDGDAEDVAFAAQAELILLAVARGEADIVSRLDALRAAGGHRHADTIAPACFITLVNHAAFEEARQITGVVQTALANLREMSRPMTHTDASVVYCAATLEIQIDGGDRAKASSWLNLLRGVGADDGDTKDVAFAAQAKLILLAVARGEADIVSRLDALRAAGGHRHADTIAPACFITLVNHAAFEEARQITGVVQTALANLREMSRPMTHTDASVVYCAATLEIQIDGGDRAKASSWLNLLRGRLIGDQISGGQNGLFIGADLYWPAVDAEILSWRLMGQTETADRVSLEASRSAMEAGFPGHATA